MSARPKVVLSTNCCWNAWNFRASLMRALQAAGYEVVVLTPRDDYAQRLVDLGVTWIDIPMQARGRNPLKDLNTLLSYLRILYRLQPAFYLGFTIKPNVYGTLACRALGIKTINNIAGLGALFDRDSWLQGIAASLYRYALRDAHQVFFQNQLDQQYFLEQGILDGVPSLVLPGSGVDTLQFRPEPATRKPDTSVHFIMSSRLLWTKGVGEYIDAIRQLKPRLPHARWHLMGFCGEGGDAVSRSQIAAWEAEGLVQYHGVSDAIHTELPQFDCFVLPSYYNEGTPRSLLEAASCGLPIITTDWKGCRDVVIDQTTGYLCQPRCAEDLASKMSAMAQLPATDRHVMGAQGRAHVLDHYSDRRIIDQYLNAMSGHLPQNLPTT